MSGDSVVDCAIADVDWRLREIESMSLVARADTSVRVLSETRVKLCPLAEAADGVVDELDEVDDATVVVDDAFETGVNELNWFKLELLLLDDDVVASDAGDTAACLRASTGSFLPQLMLLLLVLLFALLLLLLLLLADFVAAVAAIVVGAFNAAAADRACWRLICWFLAACAVGIKL